MLCPKCDYISFDHLTNCAKCNHNLAEIASLLNGTSVSSVQVNYLGINDEMSSDDDGDNIIASGIESVVDGGDFDSGLGDSASSEEQDDFLEMTGGEVSDTLEQALEELSEEDSLLRETQGPALEVSAPEMDEEFAEIEPVETEKQSVEHAGSEIEFAIPPALDVNGIQGPGSGDESNLDLVSEGEADESELEMPDIGGVEFDESVKLEEQQTPLAALELEVEPDSADLEVEVVEEAGEELPQTPTLTLSEEKIEAPSQPENVHSADLDIDESALTLEVDDDDQGSGLTFEADSEGTGESEIDSAGTTGIDLGNIDLSDLVYALDPENQGEPVATVDNQATDAVSQSSVPENDMSLRLESDADSEDSDEDNMTPSQDLPGADHEGLDGKLKLESEDNTADAGDHSIDFDTGADKLVELSDEDDAFDNLDMSIDLNDDDEIDLDLEIDDDK